MTQILSEINKKDENGQKMAQIVPKLTKIGLKVKQKGIKSEPN